MTTTTIMTAVAVNANGDNFNPVKLTLAAATTRVSVTAVWTLAQSDNIPVVEFATLPVDLIIDSRLARSMQAAEHSPVSANRGADLGVPVYSTSYPEVPRGGYLYAWLNIPSGVYGTVTVIINEI